MRYASGLWLVLGLAIVPALFTSPALALNIIDIIPLSDSSESNQNSEPNLAVNPINPNQAVISAFGPVTNFNPFTLGANPYFTTTNGGTTWTRFDNLQHGDTSTDWGRNGANVYMANLDNTPNAITIYKDASPSTTPWTSINANGYGALPDQPWLVTGRGVDPRSNTVQDRLYTGFNNLTNFPGKTASVRVSTDGGVTFSDTVIENTVPGAGQDGPAVRLAVNGNTVYAAFERWTSTNLTENNNGSVYGSQIVIVRDDNGATGGTKFQNLNGAAGKVIATTQVPFTQTLGPRSLGNERVGSDLAIAVDPNNANHVYVAYAEVPGAANSGQMRVVVQESTDGGATWTSKFTTTTDTSHRQGLPALAVTANGSVGLQYTAYDGQANKLEQHFVQTSNNFATTSDKVLERFTNNDPLIAFDITPYLGDYMDLVAIDDTFYGTFSSSNNLRDAEFPNGGPTLQRSFTGTEFTNSFTLTADGRPVSFSIDPYYFTDSANVPEPSTLLFLGAGLVGVAGIAWRRNR